MVSTADAPFPEIDLLAPDLRHGLDEAAASLAAAGERLETNERALAALPASVWEQSPRGPTRGEARALGAGRRRLLEAMWSDLTTMVAARRAVRIAAARAVVRDRSFEAAVPLLEREQAWECFCRIHADCVLAEHALIELGALLGAMRPEDRAEVVAVTRAVRSSLAWARPQFALLPRLPPSERVRVARRLQEELGAVREHQGPLRELLARHGGHFLLGFPDPDVGARVRGLLARLVQRILRRLPGARRRGPLDAICEVQRAWRAEGFAMADAIAHHVRLDPEALRREEADEGVSSEASAQGREDAN